MRETSENAPQAKLHRMPFDEYLAVDAEHNTSLKVLADKTPKHYKAHKDHPQPPTEAMIHGDAFHQWILEKDAFNDNFLVVHPKDDGKYPVRRGAAGLAWWANVDAEANGRHIIKSGTQAGAEKMNKYLDLGKMRGSVLEHDTLGPMLTRATEKKLTELALFWDEPVGDHVVGMKTRIDILDQYEGFAAVVDFKKCQDASSRFSRDIANYNLHFQAAVIMRGLRAAFGDAERLYFLAPIEATQPWACAAYQLAPSAIAEGDYMLQQALDLLVECRENDSWPGYPGVTTIDIPSYAYKSERMD